MTSGGPLPAVRVRRLSEAPALREHGVTLVDAYLRLPDAWEGAAPDALPPVLQQVVAGYPGRAVPPAGEVLVAEVDAMAVGQVLLVPHEPGGARLERMYVVEGQRGRGLGRLLLEDALAVAASLGHRRVVLDVMPERTGAFRLYRRQGFTPIEPYAENHRPMRFLGRDLAPPPGRSLSDRPPGG